MEPSISPPSPEAAAVKDATTDTFATDVVQASDERPVIVDFWAPWCGPCKQLGPALERVVQAARGAVRLVKINIDENPQLAAALGVQSIPAVFAFHQGRPVDGFLGALPESQIKSFVDKLVQLTGGQPPGAAEADVLDQADSALAGGDAAGANALYAQVLGRDSSNARAWAGLVRCALAGGDSARARELLEEVPADLATAPEIGGARSAVELAEEGPAAAVGDLQARLETDPDDHQARFDLALALYAQGQPEGAIDQLLDLVGRGREWNDEAARKQLVKLFDALGQTHPLTISGRRRLSSLLFA
jgi:putative thioredoxin